MNHETEIVTKSTEQSSPKASSPARVPLPQPRVSITTRLATLGDLPFIDGLQKKHTKQVGWMPTATLEGKIKLGHVLVAEESLTADFADDADWKETTNISSSSAQSAKSAVPTPLGYCIGNDQYFKRDDVGIIYQMNIVPEKQRGFAGATLLKAMFERSAYGCKFYCCWCAQDVAANKFWESMGFVPLAFRAGSRAKDRVHIFWQRRIRSGDCQTPYWFPSQTTGGSIREDRLVFPIPPGVRWDDEMPRVLPQGDQGSQIGCRGSGEETKCLPGKQSSGSIRTPKPDTRTPMPRAMGGWNFIPPTPIKAARRGRASKQMAPRVKHKNDPKLTALARELRDRWLERVNDDPSVLLSQGKYEVSRGMTNERNGKSLAVEPT